MSTALKATSYKRQSPEELPIDWEAKPDLHWDEVCLAVGFDPRGNEIAWGQLSADWNGHPRGAAVLTGLQDEKGWFTIVEHTPGVPPTAKPYKIRIRGLHRAGALVAYELGAANPKTNRLYRSAPRVRCAVADLVECRRLFQQQTLAWATGKPVPDSRFMNHA